MSKTGLAQDSNSQGSSSEGDSVRMEGNLLRQDEPQEPIQPQNPQGQPVVQAVATPSRAPIDKLPQHRGYPFAKTIKEKLEEAKYWLERITHIVTKQLSCSDEHKLECAVALLVNEALSWWETATLTTPTEKVTWSSLWRNSRRSISGNNTSMKEGRSSCTSSKVVNLFVNYRTRGRKQKRDDRPQWQSQKAKYHNEDSITYTPTARSNFTPRPPTGIKLAIPKVSVSSERNLEKILPCKFCQKWHRCQCQIQYNLRYACGRDDHFIINCPRNIRKSQFNLLQNRASHHLFGIKALNKFNLENKEEMKEIIQRLLLTRNFELESCFDALIPI
ncbi:hypothetical protein GQ457_12G015160 [Hibiscus cannabinus]